MYENQKMGLKKEGLSELSFSPMQLIDLNLVLELESASHSRKIISMIRYRLVIGRIVCEQHPVI